MTQSTLVKLVAAVVLASAPIVAQFDGIATTYGPPDGESPQGGNCALMSWLDFAPRFHVAMNDKQWSSGIHCGRCVAVSCTDPRCTSREQVVGQITDRCPECSFGDLDMSLPMFNKITGYTTDRLKIHWSFVDCPVKGGVQVCAKSGSSKHWLYVQASNSVQGVASMNINGAPAPVFDSAFYFMSQVLGTVELADTQITMTSHGGDSITTKVALEPNKCTQIPQQFATGSRPVPAPAPAPPVPPPQTPPPATPAPPTPPPATPAPPTNPPATPKPPTKAPATTTVEPTTTPKPTTTTAAPETTTSAPETTTAPPTTTATPETTTAPPTTTVPEVNATSPGSNSTGSGEASNKDEITKPAEQEHAAGAPVANPASENETPAQPATSTPTPSPEVTVGISVRSQSESLGTSNIIAISFGCACAVGMAILAFVAYRARRRIQEAKRIERESEEFALRSLSEAHVLGQQPAHDIAIL